MKHLKIFENRDGRDEVLDAMVEFDRICDLIKDFINLEQLHNKKVKDIYHYYFEKDVDEMGDMVLFALFGDNDKHDNDDNPGVMLFEEDQKKLYEFIQNPELYKNTKNFNL